MALITCCELMETELVIHDYNKSLQPDLKWLHLVEDLRRVCNIENLH